MHHYYKVYFRFTLVFLVILGLKGFYKMYFSLKNNLRQFKINMKVNIILSLQNIFRFAEKNTLYCEVFHNNFLVNSKIF